MRMNHDLSNTNVSLQKENDVYVIRHDDTVAGKIWMENDTVNIHIQPEYQGRHYATNALYLFTAYAHDNLKVHEIRAVVPAGDVFFEQVAFVVGKSAKSGFDVGRNVGDAEVVDAERERRRSAYGHLRHRHDCFVLCKLHDPAALGLCSPEIQVRPSSCAASPAP